MECPLYQTERYCLFRNLRETNYYFIANKTAMGLDKKLSQLMDYPLPTNNTHIIMSTKIAHTQI
jgi:predicted secreted Zn-dependent protease